MEDSQIVDLLRKKSPQTTLEVAKAVKMSWHVIQEQLLEMQIDGKLDRITVGRQNLWFLKGQKWKGSLPFANSILLGIVAILVIAVFLQSAGINITGSVSYQNTTYVWQTTNDSKGGVSDAPEYSSEAMQKKIGISYNVSTNTISLTSDDKMCTLSKPCTMTDIYNASMLNGWGRVDNLYNYFIINAKIEIDGYFVSEYEHIYTTQPWKITKNGNVRFGISDNNRTYGSVFFETNVTDELTNNAAIFNEGVLQFYDSNYKIYGSGDSNIYQTNTATFKAKRFDIQRLQPGSTKLYVPLNHFISDYVGRDYVKIICAGDCTIGGVSL